MLYYAFRRLSVIPFLVLIANFAGFTYAHLSLRVQLMKNPYGSAVEAYPPVFSLYADYVRRIFQGNFGMPTPESQQTIMQGLGQALVNSLGLVLLAFILSLLVGFLLGLSSVRMDPPGIAGWLAPLSSIGLALPSFYTGAVLILLALSIILARGPHAESWLPAGGFGWDLHLLLPLLALLFRPAVHIAQVLAELLAKEMGKNYVVAARAFGKTWAKIRRRHALANVLAPVTVVAASAFRGTMGELILVEWLFNWPGIGRLLVLALVPPRISSVGGGMAGQTIYFLQPELLAGLVALFTLLFLSVDALAGILAYSRDPRLRVEETGMDYA